MTAPVSGVSLGLSSGEKPPTNQKQRVPAALSSLTREKQTATHQKQLPFDTLV